MKGADEYVKFLKSGIHGRLYIKIGQHARGSTLHVYVLKEAFSESNPLEGSVEVYGVISGDPGWTEEYGWKHKGPWVQDFELLVESGRLAVEHEENYQKALTVEHAKQERQRVEAVLKSYKAEAAP